jgi:hypothetical protein
LENLNIIVEFFIEMTWSMKFICSFVTMSQ